MITAQPSTAFEATAQFATGLTGTLGVRVTDNAGATTVARTTAGIAEYPAGSGLYYVSLTAPTGGGQYSIVWDDGSGTYASEDLLVTGVAPITVGTGDTYATVDELARLLKITNPNLAQTAAMERVLIVAAGEINAEVDLDDDSALAGWQIALASEVNLERAVEHWQQSQSPFGILGIGDTGATYIARDSWDRHALKLAPIKSQWGLA